MLGIAGNKRLVLICSSNALEHRCDSIYFVKISVAAWCCPRESLIGRKAGNWVVRHSEQFVSAASVSVAKRTMKVLKLCRWLAEAVAKKHGVYRMPDVTSQNEQVVPVLTRSV